VNLFALVIFLLLLKNKECLAYMLMICSRARASLHDQMLAWRSCFTERYPHAWFCTHTHTNTHTHTYTHTHTNTHTHLNATRTIVSLIVRENVNLHTHA
jgi:carbohydrate-binding DOMON domain-containing protein